MADDVMVKEDEEGDETLKDFVVEQVDKFFVDHIPIDFIKDLDSTYLYFFGTIAHIIAITMFVYFTYTNYYSSANQAFISLQSGPGCSTVPIAITGNFYADTEGYWIGTPNYTDSTAVYLLTLSNFKINNPQQYADMMNTFYGNLIVMGDIAKKNNLAENIITWMVYQEYYSVEYPSRHDYANIGFGQLQSMELSGTPAIVFNLPHIIARVSGYDGVCTIQNVASYDEANHVYLASYDNASAITSNKVCSSAVYPETFGYYPLIDDDVFQVALDVESFAVALGINFRLQSPSTLRVIDSATRATFRYQGIGFEIAQFFDIRFSTMEPILCVHNTTMLPSSYSKILQLFCVNVIGATFSLPVFNHFGSSSLAPNYCSCGDNGISDSEACEEFNFLTGLLFYRNVDNFNGKNFNFQQLVHSFNITKTLEELGLFDLFAVLNKYDEYRTFNYDSYNASFFTTSLSSTCKDSTCMSESLNFCNIGTNSKPQHCSLFVVNSLDYTCHTTSIFKYQLNNGSCTNSMVISRNAMDRLIANPPVEFTQLYYECYSTDFDNLLQAIGVASGNVQIFLPLIVFATLPLLYFILYAINQVPPKAEYKPQEKEQVAEILSMLLLRLRDGKTRGIKRGGVLEKLTEELIAAAKEEGGYPDSDDEEEEEEVSRSTKSSSRKLARNRSDPSLYERDMESVPSTVQRSGRGGPPPNSASAVSAMAGKRMRMAVFTKQLEPKPAPQREDSMYDQRPSGFFGRASNSLPPLGQGRLIAMLFAKNDSSHATVAASTPTPAHTIVEQPDVVLLDVNSSQLPAEIVILNNLGLDNRANHAIRRASMKTTGVSEEELDLLIEDLSKYFSEAIVLPFTPKSTPLPNPAAAPSSNKNPLHNNAQADSDDEDDYRRSSSIMRTPADHGGIELRENKVVVDIPDRKQCEAYINARQLTMRLIFVNMDLILNHDNRIGLLMKLSNIMCMHASIELELEMKVITNNRQFSEKIAYNIGGKVLTAAQLDALI